MADVIDLGGYAPSRRRGLVARIRAALVERREYRALLTELNALTDRELADIGISRQNIKDVARRR